MVDAVREVGRQRALAIGELEVSPGTIADPGAGVRILLGPDDRWYPFSPGATPAMNTIRQLRLYLQARDGGRSCGTPTPHGR